MIMGEKLNISRVVIEKVVNYLNTKPYGEVAQLISELITEANANAPKGPEAPEKEEPAIEAEMEVVE